MMRMAFFAVLGLMACEAPAQSLHVQLAEDLTDGLVAELMAGNTTSNGALLNQYGGTMATGYLVWGDGDMPYAAMAECSSFMTLLFQTAYNWDPQAFGSTGPSSTRYYDGLNRSKGGFSRIDDFALVQPGDVLASKYLDGSDASGHVMLVTGVVPGPKSKTSQTWYVEVIDASSGKHTNDSRVYGAASWQGVGRGVIRVVTQNGKIVRWGWTIDSALYAPTERPLIAAHPTFAN